MGGGLCGPSPCGWLGWLCDLCVWWDWVRVANVVRVRACLCVCGLCQCAV